MQSFYKTTQLLRDILSTNTDVHTIVFGKLGDNEDNMKKNIYPIVNILPLGASFNSSQQNVITFEVSVLNQRELSKNNLVLDKFEDNDNFIDNMNVCLAVINRLVTTLRLRNNDDQIELIGTSDALPVMYKKANILDGWYINITLALPNTQISLCS